MRPNSAIQTDLVFVNCENYADWEEILKFTVCLKCPDKNELIISSSNNHCNVFLLSHKSSCQRKTKFVIYDVTGLIISNVLKEEQIFKASQYCETCFRMLMTTIFPLINQ